MTINFGNYGNFYINLYYIDVCINYSENKSYTLKEATDFIEDKMTKDLSILSANIYDCETGEIVAIITRDNEDFANEEEQWGGPDDNPDWDNFDEVGFNPYMGCYDYDC